VEGFDELGANGKAARPLLDRPGDWVSVSAAYMVEHLGGPFIYGVG
jgi:hypothetical protein